MSSIARPLTHALLALLSNPRHTLNELGAPPPCTTSSTAPYSTRASMALLLNPKGYRS